MRESKRYDQADLQLAVCLVRNDDHEEEDDDDEMIDLQGNEIDKVSFLADGKYQGQEDDGRIGADENLSYPEIA